MQQSAAVILHYTYKAEAQVNIQNQSNGDSNGEGDGNGVDVDDRVLAGAALLVRLREVGQAPRGQLFQRDVLLLMVEF